MFDIDIPEWRPRPFWQRPVAILYVLMLPSVVAVNSAWNTASGFVHEVHESSRTIAALQGKVSQLQQELADMTANESEEPAAALAQTGATLHSTPAPPMTEFIQPVQAIPTFIPPVPVVHPAPATAPRPAETRPVAAALPAPKAIAAEVATAKKEEIPEAGKFQLISDETSKVAGKSKFTLIGDK